MGLERQISLRCKSHISAAARRCRATLLPFGRVVAVQARQAQRRFVPSCSPPSARLRGLISRPAQCVSCFPQEPQHWLDFSKVRTEMCSAASPLIRDGRGRSSASATPSMNVGKGKASGKKGVWARFSGACGRSAHAVCGLSGGFAQPCVLNASEVLPGCKNARAAARALGLAPPTTRGCSRVHNTPKGVLNVSERAFELCMASSTRECEVE